MAGNGRGDELVAAFDRWAADQRVAGAAAGRSRERSLRDQASGSATWLGLLVDLAEAGESVSLAVGGGRRSGRVVGVGTDFMVLEQANGRTALVAAGCVSALWPDQTRAPAAGDRGPRIDVDLATALSLLAEDRSPVAITAGGAPELVGDLISVGEDVLSLRCAPPARRIVHIPIRGVCVCELR